MREIKFRGISEDKESIYHTQWTFGSLVYNLDPTKEENEIRDAYIRTPLGFLSELIEIDPETIGQYTGLKDKNGVEIYEGDICKYVNPYNKESYIRDIRYCPMFACFGLYEKDSSIYEYESDWLKIVEVEVIGNIHENPELLKP